MDSIRYIYHPSLHIESSASLLTSYICNLQLICPLCLQFTITDNKINVGNQQPVICLVTSTVGVSLKQAINHYMVTMRLLCCFLISEQLSLEQCNRFWFLWNNTMEHSAGWNVQNLHWCVMHESITRCLPLKQNKAIPSKLLIVIHIKSEFHWFILCSELCLLIQLRNKPADFL
jgi:hypothetical protein